MSSVQITRSETAAHAAEVEASAFYEQHRQRVYRFCLSRLGDREDAHDAVQDTYSKAWLALRDGCVVREPLPWLLTIARNVCASRYRARSARPVETPLFEETLAAVTPLRRDEIADLPAALRALPEEQRRAFVLRELRGCSYEEICDTMGTSQASVAALLHRARRSVAAALAGTGRRALVVVPFPAVLRSAFEGSGAVVAATAATGTLLVAGPHLPLLHHGHRAPPAPTLVQSASIPIASTVGGVLGATGPMASVPPKGIDRSASRSSVVMPPALPASSATTVGAPALPSRASTIDSPPPALVTAPPATLPDDLAAPETLTLRVGCERRQRRCE